MPDPERSQRLQELFSLGIELPPGDRAAFCDRHCGDDYAPPRGGCAEGNRTDGTIEPGPRSAALVEAIG